jgi:hypothetical protein
MVRIITRRRKILSRREVKKIRSIPFHRIKKVQRIPYRALAKKTELEMSLPRKRKKVSAKKGISSAKAHSPA